mgnify:CR=1 FL=1
MPGRTGGCAGGIKKAAAGCSGLFCLYILRLLRRSPLIGLEVVKELAVRRQDH